MSNFATAGKKALLDSMAGLTLKAALYNSSANLSAATRLYSESNELGNGNGYNTGGVELTGIKTGTGFHYEEVDNVQVRRDVAWLSFDDPQWPNAAFMDAAQMLIYDAKDRTAFAVIDFDSPKNGQGATFRVELPPANAHEAIIRI